MICLESWKTLPCKFSFGLICIWNWKLEVFKSCNSVFISVLFALYYILCCTFKLTPQVLTYVQSETDSHCNYSLYHNRVLFNFCSISILLYDDLHHCLFLCAGHR